MTKRQVLDSQIRWASEMLNELDQAARFIQDRLGVTDGGVASIVFSDFDWETASVETRIAKMREYIKTEMAHQS